MGPTVIDGVQKVCEMFLVIAIFFFIYPFRFSSVSRFLLLLQSFSHFYLFIFVKIAFCVLVFFVIVDGIS